MTLWGLLLGAAALLLRWVQGRRDGAERVRRQTISLGGQQALHVVELEGRRLLVGTGPGAAPRLLVELARAAGRSTPAAGDGASPGGDLRGRGGQ